MTANRAQRMEMILDLAGFEGDFAIEWFRAGDGAVHAGETIAGGKPQTLTAPWSGHELRGANHAAMNVVSVVGAREKPLHA